MLLQVADVRLNRNADAEMVLGGLVAAVGRLQSCPEFPSLIPEFRANLAYVLPGAEMAAEMAAIDGRITVLRGLPFASGWPSFGPSDDMARLVAAVNRHDPTVNAGVSLKCDPGLIAAAKAYCLEHRLLFGSLDQAPPEGMKDGRASAAWKAEQLAAGYGAVPGMFRMGGECGKGHSLVVLGKNAVEVAETVIETVRLRRAAFSRA